MFLSNRVNTPEYMQIFQIVHGKAGKAKCQYKKIYFCISAFEELVMVQAPVALGTGHLTWALDTNTATVHNSCQYTIN